MLKKLSHVGIRLLSLAGFALAVAGGPVACRLFQDPELTIRWKTENELDIVGFNLYRSETQEGPFVKINVDLIPPAADPFIGGEHSYVDQDVVRGVTYYYQLETVDRHGNSTRTEPIALAAGN